MKFIKMLPPACESGAFDEDVRQPIMMLMSLMEVLVLEEFGEPDSEGRQSRSRWRYWR